MCTRHHKYERQRLFRRAAHVAALSRELKLLCFCCDTGDVGTTFFGREKLSLAIVYCQSWSFATSIHFDPLILAVYNSTSKKRVAAGGGRYWHCGRRRADSCAKQIMAISQNPNSACCTISNADSGEYCRAIMQSCADWKLRLQKWKRAA